MSDAVTAVLAHGMLSSLAVVQSAMGFLRTRNLDDAARRELEDAMDEQMTLIVDALKDLARGFPAEALSNLQARTVATHVDLTDSTAVDVVLSAPPFAGRAERI